MAYRERSGDASYADKSGTFWRDRSGHGWHWEPDGDEHRLINRDGELAARINHRGDKWKLTYPRIIPERCGDTADQTKRAAVTVALSNLPLDPKIAARLAQSNPEPIAPPESAPSSPPRSRTAPSNLPLLPSEPLHGGDPFAIPDFLLRHRVAL